MTVDPVLRVVDVRVHFGGVHALDNVSVSFPEGQITGLIGPNGSGKTTLLNVLSGYVIPTGGRVELRGRRLSVHKPQDAAHLGLVRTFQDGRLLESETALTNLEWAAEGYASEGLRSELAHLLHPFDVNTVRAGARTALSASGLRAWSGVLVSACSGGIRNHLAITAAQMAWSAVRNPVFLLDEPFAGVEPAGAGRMMVSIRDLVQNGASVILVDHRLNYVRELCSQVVVLHSGRVLASGPTRDVISNPAVVTTYIGTDA